MNILLVLLEHRIHEVTSENRISKYNTYERQRTYIHTLKKKDLKKIKQQLKPKTRHV